MLQTSVAARLSASGSPHEYAAEIKDAQTSEINKSM
jgi:hypothetical protein